MTATEHYAKALEHLDEARQAGGTNDELEAAHLQYAQVHALLALMRPEVRVDPT